jgi:thioesterase domain-containing protein/acyl carrier protein
VLREAQGGNSVLAAYVIPTREAPIALDSLKAFATGRLPEYMVPAFYVSLQGFPLTPSGKIDLRGLPAAHGGAEAEEPCPVPPRSDVEKRMMEIWLQLLERETLGIRDSFFDLGGHSLLAVRLIARVERMFGVQLPVSVLFDYPTVEALSRAVEERNPRLSRSTVVRLQKGEGGRPFFCVPPAASSVNHFAPWVLALSSDIPFYAMHALGLEPGEVPQDRVEDLAARYIADMRAVQPVGPYSIGGRCFGAYVAYEMALQLSKSGEDVALLALLDPTLPPGVRRGFRYYVKRAGYFSRRKELARALLLRVRWTVRQTERLRVLLYLGTRHTRRIQRTYKAHLHASKTYAPRVYSGTITYFAPRDEYSADDVRPLWKQLTTAEVDLHLVPGSHRTMSQGSHLKTLVEDLEKVIREARRARAPARTEEQQP